MPDTIKLVFDNVAWNGKDVGDNSQFWKPKEWLSYLVILVVFLLVAVGVIIKYILVPCITNNCQ